MRCNVYEDLKERKGCFGDGRKNVTAFIVGVVTVCCGLWSVVSFKGVEIVLSCLLNHESHVHLQFFLINVLKKKRAFVSLKNPPRLNYLNLFR